MERTGSLTRTPTLSNFLNRREAGPARRNVSGSGMVAIMQFSIVQEAPSHQESIHDLMEIAFGPERTKRTVHRFRESVGPIDGLRYVATDETSAMLGSIRFWPVQLPDGTPTALLGPLAVLPELRGKGIGHALVTHGLERAKLLKHRSVLIVGDPGYYAPFGFRADHVTNLTLPGPVTPLTFMGLELEPGHLLRQQGAVLPLHQKSIGKESC